MEGGFIRVGWDVSYDIYYLFNSIVFCYWNILLKNMFYDTESGHDFLLKTCKKMN